MLKFTAHSFICQCVRFELSWHYDPPHGANDPAELDFHVRTRPRPDHDDRGSGQLYLHDIPEDPGPGDEVDVFVDW